MMCQLRSFVRAIGILSSLVFIGCGDGEDEKAPGGQEQTGLEIAGTWESNFGGTEIIADESWEYVGTDSTSSTEIVDFDNDENVLITVGPKWMEPEVDVYTRVVWTEPRDGSFYYCMVAFNLETLDDALNSTETADDSDPDTTGCGASPWTKLSAP